jgi:hypothetical protein
MSVDCILVYGRAIDGRPCHYTWAAVKTLLELGWAFIYISKPERQSSRDFWEKLGLASSTFPQIKLYTKTTEDDASYHVQGSYSSSEFAEYVRSLGTPLPAIHDTSCFYTSHDYTNGYVIVEVANSHEVYKLVSDSQNFIYRPRVHELEIMQKELESEIKSLP